MASLQICRCLCLPVNPPDLPQLDELEPGFTLRLMYAGHVLGAVMAEVRRGSDAVLYTGTHWVLFYVLNRMRALRIIML